MQRFWCVQKYCGILKQLLISDRSDPFCQEKILLLRIVRCTGSLYHLCSVAEQKGAKHVWQKSSLFCLLLFMYASIHLFKIRICKMFSLLFMLLLSRPPILLAKIQKIAVWCVCLFYTWQQCSCLKLDDSLLYVSLLCLPAVFLAHPCVLDRTASGRQEYIMYAHRKLERKIQTINMQIQPKHLGQIAFSLYLNTDEKIITIYHFFLFMYSNINQIKQDYYNKLIIIGGIVLNEI